MSSRILNLLALHQKVSSAYDIHFDREYFLKFSKSLEQKIVKRLGIEIDWADPELLVAPLVQKEEEDLQFLTRFVDEQLEFQSEKHLCRYLVITGEKGKETRHYMNLRRAGVTYDNMWAPVRIGDYVLHKDYSLRAITEEERNEISEIAEEHSGSK